MRTVVVAASKGGVGKTTLAIAFATAKMATGERVGILDLDSYQSLTRWTELRRAAGGTIDLVPPATRLEETVADLKGRYDWLIVDTPPLPRKTIEAAISVADVVVIPVRPSPLDVGQTDFVVDICSRLGKPFLFVPTLSANTALLAGARAALTAKGRVSRGNMAMRDVYMTALLDGRSGNEVDEGAKKEIGALWDDVESIQRVRKRGKVKHE